jgi:hypothetical protein
LETLAILYQIIRCHFPIRLNSSRRCSVFCLRLRTAHKPRLFRKAKRGLEPINCRGAVHSSFPHAIVYFIHNSPNVLAQIANTWDCQETRRREPATAVWGNNQCLPSLTTVGSASAVPSSVLRYTARKQERSVVAVEDGTTECPYRLTFN